MTTESDVAILVGRCNPFHKGHAQLVRHSAKTSKLTVLLLGSAGLARSLRNPFTYYERKAMVDAWLKSEGITNVVVAGQRDYPYNNTLWIRSVQQNVSGILDVVERDRFNLPRKPTINIVGSDRDETTWYLHAFPRWKPRLIDVFGAEYGPIGFNATEVRELLFSKDVTDATTRLVSMLPNTTYTYLEQFLGSPECARLQRWHEQNKRYKEAWSVAPYAPIFVTCDAVIIQSGHILVVERGAEPGMGLWALPGGFLNQGERIKDGIIRETIEETGILLAEGKRAKEITADILRGSIRKLRVFDHPQRSERGRTITHAALIRLDDTKPLPVVKGQFAPLADSNFFRLGNVKANPHAGGENERSWNKIIKLFEKTELVSIDDLVRAVSDHSSGGRNFVINHCVRLSWLEPELEIETAKAFWMPIDEALSRMDMWFEDHHAIIETLAGGEDL